MRGLTMLAGAAAIAQAYEDGTYDTAGYDTAAVQEECVDFHGAASCDPFTWYCNGWCEHAEGCPEGTDWECLWKHNDGHVCECVESSCPTGMVRYIDWKVGMHVCVRGHLMNILEEYEPVAGEYDWEKDCGQGRDEWGNLKWGGERSYNWGTGMCELRETCQEGHATQWNDRGEFCMWEGEHELKCPATEMMTHFWNQVEMKERLACVPKHDRPVIHPMNKFNKHEEPVDDYYYMIEEETEELKNSDIMYDTATGENEYKEEKFETAATTSAGMDNVNDSYDITGADKKAAETTYDTVNTDATEVAGGNHEDATHMTAPAATTYTESYDTAATYVDSYDTPAATYTDSTTGAGYKHGHRGYKAHRGYAARPHRGYKVPHAGFSHRGHGKH